MTIDLAIIPFHDWRKSEREGFRTRDGHFLHHLSKHPAIGKLLVINRPISWAEIVLFRRNWRVQQGKLIDKQHSAYLTQINDKTYTLDIVIPELVQPLIKHRNWIPEVFGSPHVLKIVRTTLERMQMAQHYGMLVSAPIFVPLVKQLNPHVFALDAQDNLLKHSLYRDVPKLADYYQYCLDSAQLLTTNSHETQKWFASQRPDALWIPNGVDPNVFNAENSYPLPPDLAAVRRPVVGYAGKMQEMFDVNLMMQTATALPSVNFVCIGQVLDQEWVKPLWKLPNVFYLGDKHYTELPAYLAGFDICTIPYNQTRQHNVDPIKFYEYVAMGKPVVTTAIGNVEAFFDFPQVHIAHSADEFIAGIQSELGILQQSRSRIIRKLPEENYWAFKIEQIAQKLATLLAANQPPHVSS